MEALGVLPSASLTNIRLGNPVVLYDSVSHAAEKLGVVSPIQRRDRSSGATKRRQEEIEEDYLQLTVLHG